MQRSGSQRTTSEKGEKQKVRDPIAGRLAGKLMDVFQALTKQLQWPIDNKRGRRTGLRRQNHFPTANGLRCLLGETNAINTVDQWRKDSPGELAREHLPALKKNCWAHFILQPRQFLIPEDLFPSMLSANNLHRYCLMLRRHKEASTWPQVLAKKPETGGESGHYSEAIREM